jgi:hypothetical protein
MNINFIFDDNFHSEPRSEIIRNIERFAVDRHDGEARPCHVGTISVYVGYKDARREILQGVMICSCGKRYCTFEGTGDCSSGCFRRVA